jgi:hypothetical protein
MAKTVATFTFNIAWLKSTFTHYSLLAHKKEADFHNNLPELDYNRDSLLFPVFLTLPNLSTESHHSQGTKSRKE